MDADLVFLVTGGALFLAVILPSLLTRLAVSAPIVLLVVGALLGLLPWDDLADLSPQANLGLVEHLTEFGVIVALMGVGLALDRPLDPRDRASWRRWGAAWRLLGIAMPLTIAGVALLGWTLMGLAPAAALLLGAVLAPTDPVLASDVQVGGPTSSTDPEDQLDIDEEDEVRFALTSEAGLNDGLAFPFVYAAIFLAGAGPVSDWALRWVAWELVGKTLIGIAVGIAVGWVLAKATFGGTPRRLRVAEIGEPLLALAAVMLAYGTAEVVQGYGFLAVFACAMTLRSAERGSTYHVDMHQFVERLERVLTLVILLLLGIAMTNGLLSGLTLPSVLVAVLLVLVVRPAAGMLALSTRGRHCHVGGHVLTPGERAATAFFGIRGIGSLFYLAYATAETELADSDLLWSTVTFTIMLSVLVHGVAATPVMRRLDGIRESTSRTAHRRAPVSRS